MLFQIRDLLVWSAVGYPINLRDEPHGHKKFNLSRETIYTQLGRESWMACKLDRKMASGNDALAWSWRLGFNNGIRLLGGVWSTWLLVSEE